MLNPDEAKTLARWCRMRRLSCLEDRGADGRVGWRLESSTAPDWYHMRLIAEPDGFILLDRVGDTLASASDLQALLDAVDAGVAERPRVMLARHAASAVLASVR